MVVVADKVEKKVVLIFGGTSSERLVSVASAQNLVAYLQEPELYFINSDGKWVETNKKELLAHQNPFTQIFQSTGETVATHLEEMKSRLLGKLIFISLHGTEGEDGTYQRFFEENKISFIGSSSKSSALCFDKVKAKAIAKSSGIPLAQELLADFSKAETVVQVKEFFNKYKKVVLKPVANGSSFGLFIVNSEIELQQAVKTIINSTEKLYLCEEFINGRELTVGVYEVGNTLRALCPSEVILETGSNFDYEGKYLGKGSKEITPAVLSAEQKRQCQELALKAHQIFSCYGYSRTDMILKDQGPVFLETNTLPGMTKASFYPQQLSAENLSFQQFINDQLNMAEGRFV
ncbi:MAG: ATP-grasp domain-containing protein [Bdellovibrionaceae bacterium]|nr:ATP-grasp domain-containing protein [Pseudobdellovibrionaceae bacterium]NUM57121.1 ATP-grasp domain-containing protein [Pseudobdellovibrionaceae bacterium]